MFLNHWKLVMASALSLSCTAWAADLTDQVAYCSYVIEQAQAQRDLLRTPVAAGGMTQPETGLPLQLVGGASLGLSDFRKAGLTMAVARKNCELYKATTAAQQDVQYALSSLEKEALRNRLSLIDQASKSLDELLEKASQMVEAQTATRPMLFSLQTTKIKLETDRADTESKIAAIYVPPLSGKPLKQLVADKQNGEVSQQRALDRLNRQNSWDVALSVGVHQQVNPVAYGAQPYGAVSVNYNLASHAINKHLDHAADSYSEWKKLQEGDVIRNTEVLRQQLLDSIVVQEAKLKSLQAESGQIDKNLQTVANPDTSAALDFHNQLSAAQLLLQIETEDASFRTGRLREYLEKNY
jgi:vacuolar-type H+-ATPase subunit H